MVSAPQLWRPSIGLLWLALVCSLLGCRKQEQISTYTVVRLAGQTSGKQRMLAAMVPQANRAWFFKLQGPDEAVAAEADNFRKLVGSVEFEGGSPQWQLPDKWTRLRASGMRFATFEIETDGKPLNATVIPLPMEADSPEYRLSNVNRWRGQLGLDSIAMADLEQNVEQIPLTSAGATAVMVNLLGSPLAAVSPDPPGPAGAAPPFAGGAPPFAGGGSPKSTRQQAILGVIAIHKDRSWFVKYSGDAELALAEEKAFKDFVGSIRFTDGDPPLTHTAPANWVVGKAGGFRKLAFTLAKDDLRGEVTVIDLAAAGGELLPNVNRWRKQVGLEPINDAQLKKDIEELSLGEVPGAYLKIVGAEPTGADNGD